MRISSDSEADALSITFLDTTVTTRELGDGLAAEYDAEGHLAGLELLDAARRAGGRSALKQIVLKGLGRATIAEP